MIALKTGSRDFVLLPEYKADVIQLRETGLVVLCEGHMYLLHESANTWDNSKDFPKHNILEHVLTTLDCYL